MNVVNKTAWGAEVEYVDIYTRHALHLKQFSFESLLTALNGECPPLRNDGICALALDGREYDQMQHDATEIDGPRDSG